MEVKKLFVGGLPREADEETLKDHFKEFGEVEESLIIREPSTGNGRGFGFVTFTKPTMADYALGFGRQHGHLILGKKVDVKAALPKSYRREDQSNGYVKTYDAYNTDLESYNPYRFPVYTTFPMSPHYNYNWNHSQCHGCPYHCPNPHLSYSYYGGGHTHYMATTHGGGRGGARVRITSPKSSSVAVVELQMGSSRSSAEPSSSTSASSAAVEPSSSSSPKRSASAEPPQMGGPSSSSSSPSPERSDSTLTLDDKVGTSSSPSEPNDSNGGDGDALLQ